MIIRLFSISSASILFCIAIFLQYCGTSQYQDATINWEDFKSEINAADINTIDSSNEGKTIHLSGKVTTNKYVKDKEIGVSYKGISLLRVAQIYQWIETTGFTKGTKGTTSGKGGMRKGGTGSKMIDVYQTIWTEQPVDHINFSTPEGHENSTPIKKHPNSNMNADFYKMGAFEVSGSLFDDYITNPLPLKQELTELNLLEGYVSKINEDGKLVVYSSAAAIKNPQIGDVRYIYSTLSDTFSIIGTQVGHQIFGGGDEQAVSRSLLRAGIYNAEELVNLNTTELKEGAHYVTYISFFLVFLSMLFLDKLFKSTLSSAKIWKLFIPRAWYISSLINAIWVFALLYLVCNYRNDFSIALIATPIIFTEFAILFIVLILMGKQSNKTVDFSNN